MARLDRLESYMRGYMFADDERRRERRWWIAAVVVAVVVGYQLGWWVA